MRRRCTGRGLLLLVSTLPACLLYTERINGVPRAVIQPPSAITPGQRVRFQSLSQDPDGDPVTAIWSWVPKACPAGPDDWSAATPVLGMGPDQGFDFMVARQPFCVRLVVRDSSGAQSPPATFSWQPVNHPPVAALDVEAPSPATPPYPLYSSFRLSAARSSDPDGDPLTFSWTVTDDSGDAIANVDCPSASPDHAEACFSADLPGTFTASVLVDDGTTSVRQSLPLTVAADQPPCIEDTDPTIDTPEVVLAVTDPPRRFEVRRVRDDGNPLPPGPHGTASFRWYIGGPAGESRQIGFEGPTLDVSAASFPDARPGSVYRVRVEPRDPMHDSPATLRDVQDCPSKPHTCEVPPGSGCLRSVAWEVHLR